MPWNKPRTEVSGSKVRSVFLALAVVGLSGLAAPMSAHAEKAPIYTGLFNKVAVGGYDAVSYFGGSPEKGDKAYSTTWQGAEFLFASQANLDAFLAEPDRYAPQYGGYCAWAVSQGYTAKGDPKYWKIVDGRLFLNFNADIQEKWEADIPGLVAAADANWPRVLK